MAEAGSGSELRGRLGVDLVDDDLTTVNKQNKKGQNSMGDRGNIAVLQSNGDQVWLYSHWGGSELPERLQAGLKAGKDRWTDESYLTKIIFGHAVPAKNWMEETGYGISCRMQDNEHPILVVDIPKQRVFTMPESDLKNGQVPPDYEPKHAEGFEVYSSRVLESAE